VQHVVRVKSQSVERAAEDDGMRLVGAYRFGDEDELDGQGEVPGRQVLVIRSTYRLASPSTSNRRNSCRRTSPWMARNVRKVGCWMASE